MSSLTSILEGIRPRDVLASIDLLETYLHIPILPAQCRFLRFCYAGRHLQYQALPFGLASAPRCFTKILAAIGPHLRLMLVRLQAYLDDILVQASSLSRAKEDLDATI